jgi:hypothetical protein
MAGLNDTLTLGLILVLLFGAVSLYLYTRIQQCEQKLNLVESILLDIKMSAELQGYPEPPPTQQQNQQNQQSQQSQQNQSAPTMSPFVSMDEQELYQGALEEALEENTVEVDDIQEIQEDKTSPTVEAPKLTTNYESMTLSELKAIAKQRGITGSSSMKRSQILEALRPKAVPADGGILSALAEQGSPVVSS